MKAIINDKLYDTDVAEKIFVFRRKVDKGAFFWNDQYRYTPYHNHDIYRTEKGNYFLHDTEDSVLSEITEREVGEIIKKLDADKYIELFGEVEMA